MSWEDEGKEVTASEQAVGDQIAADQVGNLSKAEAMERSLIAERDELQERLSAVQQRLAGVRDSIAELKGEK